MKGEEPLPLGLPEQPTDHSKVAIFVDKRVIRLRIVPAHANGVGWRATNIVTAHNAHLRIEGQIGLKVEEGQERNQQGQTLQDLPVLTLQVRRPNL